MNTQTDKSSNIAGVSYWPGPRTMHITFRGGRTYRYRDVPQDLYEALLAADSIGKYFAAHVRPHFKGAIVESDGIETRGRM